MKHAIFLILLTVLLACSEKKNSGSRLEPADITKFTGKTVEKIFFNKQYNVDHTPELEHVLLYSTEGKLKSAFVKHDKSAYIGTEQILENKGEYLKSQFINTGDGYSHILHIFQNADRYSLVIAAPDFLQEIKASKEEASKLFIQKIQDNKSDEILLVAERVYRFNGLEYTEFNSELPFLFYEGFRREPDGDYINISNRGAFTGRAIITLSFPGAENHDLKLRREFSHVKQYSKGAAVHYRGGKSVRTTAPMIEIVREPFASGARMSLPLTIEPTVQKMLLRAVYTFRGAIMNWPTTGVTDQQGYSAMVLDLTEKNNR